MITMKVTELPLYSMEVSNVACHIEGSRKNWLYQEEGNAWVVAVKDGNMQKTVIARPEHLKPLE